MKNDIQSTSVNDKLKWSKEHSLSLEQKQKLIEDKLKRALKQVELENKIKTLLK
jgi:hypothetical protein